MLTYWLESSLLARSVLNLAHFSSVIDVSILSVDLSVLVLRLDFEAAICRLVAKGVRSVIVVTVDLFQDGNRGSCRLRLRVVVLCDSDGG